MLSAYQTSVSSGSLVGNLVICSRKQTTPETKVIIYSPEVVLCGQIFGEHIDRAVTACVISTQRVCLSHQKN